MLTPNVVKVGGALLDDGAWLRRFAVAAAGAGPLVIVHGGGAAISESQRRLGVPVTKRNGVRVTTPEVAALVSRVLCGPVRDAILGPLTEAGLDPVGIAGLDGFLEVQLVDEAVWGRVGTVTGVDTAELRALLGGRKTPVLAPISLGPDGRLVNVNADAAASAVAAALSARQLTFVTDVPGVLDAGGRLLPRLSYGDIHALIETGVVTGGMVAKLRAAEAAAVRTVRIGDLDVLRSAGAGTTITLSRSRTAA